MNCGQLFRNFYSGKRIFLTGHTGFKGSWLLYWLHCLGAEVKGYALAPEQPESLYNEIKGDDLCVSVIADIRDKARIEKEVQNFQPDFIFHLAAQPLVRLSYEIPSQTFEVNSIGTAYVLDALRKLSKPCIGVMITTDKVYENREWVHSYRENDALGGYDPYSASKACAELVISSYRNSFFNSDNYPNHQKAVASARAGNVIGGGDWARDRIIPDIVRSLINCKPVPIRNPSAVRPWQHVLEPLAGYLHLGVKLGESPKKFSQAWNFGPSDQDNLTVQALVEISLRFWGEGSYIEDCCTAGLHEAGLLKLEISKATMLLGWKPKWSAEEAIKRTLNFYKNSGRMEVRHLMMNDINAYEQT